jgi:flagellar biosynthesis component FlhA
MPRNTSRPAPGLSYACMGYWCALRKLVGENLDVATPVILCPVNTRFQLRRLLEPILPKIVVISHGKIPALTPVHSIGILNA